MLTKLAKLSAIILILFSCVGTTMAQKERGIYDPSLTRAEMIRNWEQFNDQYDKRWMVEWNKTTGTPHRISGHYIEISEIPTRENISNISVRLLNTYQKLLQIEPDNLSFVSANFDKPRIQKPGYGTWYINYQQIYQGLPVYGGSVNLIIQNQKLTVICSDFYREIEVSTIPKISKEQAAEIASQGLSDVPILPITCELVIFPKLISSNRICYYTTWKLVMPVLFLPQSEIDIRLTEKVQKGKIPVQWCFFIDAATGNVIERMNLAKSEDLSGKVTGMIYPQNPTDVPQMVNISHLNIKLNQTGTDYNQTTDANGNYLFTDMLNGSATLEANFVGTNVVIHNNETTDPDATHLATVNIPGVHDWNWTIDDASPNDVETNAFYHVNNIRDWFLRGDPYNVTPIADPLHVHVRDGVYFNAYYYSGDGLRFGSDSPGEWPDFALCADIIYHEYTHAISDKCYVGILFPYSGQTGAMDEGWSDYFACTITDDPIEGEGVSINRNISTPDMHFPENWYNDVHDDSPIFSGAIWDSRTSLGMDYTDDLAFRALKKLSTSFGSYLGAFLEEDDNPAYNPSANGDMTDGTPNIDVISNCFYDLHGIFHKYIIGHTEKPIAVISSPDPTQLSFYNNTIEIIGSAARSRTNPMSNFIIEYANSETPTTWLNAGVTLAGDGTAPVTEANLATIDINGLADGKYLIRLTVTDAGGVINSVTTKVIIDRLLAVGWPQNLDTYYYYPFVVADVDQSTPGLEIVATTGYMIYVYHADGSLYTPWPINGFNYIKSAPVCADLDNDGQFEIIVSCRDYLNVWYHDGTLAFYTYYGGSGVNNYIFPSPVVADLDSDGDLEIIAATASGSVFIVHHDGSSFSCNGFTWPKAAGGGIYSTPAIADLDNDLQKEITFGCSDGYVYAWNLDGTNVAGNWPINIGQSTLSSSAIGDIDNDLNHDLEIVIGAEDSKVYAWHHDGNLVAGNWPVTIPANSYYGIMSSPALADLDHNGDLEVIIGGVFNPLKVLEHDGSYSAGWNPASVSFIANSPVIGDLDGNEFPEIVAGGYSGMFYAFHPDGTNVSDFPRETVSSFQFGAPLITDLNQDGSSEIIAGSKGLYVWTLPNSYNRSTQNWPTFHHDMRCTGFYGAGSDLAKINIRNGSTNIAHGTGKYNFGDLVADGTGLVMSQDITFTIENLGVIDLEISNLSISSGDTRDFILSDNTSSPVPPSGGTTSFTIRFDPISTGSKTALVSVTTNDINRNPFIFAITGNGVPMDKIVFPPTYSLPWEGGPFIDGIVDKNPDPAGNPELGWNNAYRLTYGNGTNAQTAFQCLRYTYGSDPSIYMSFEVKNDPVFDDEDLIILNFRPDKNIDDQPQNDFRIFIYPVYSNQGARDPSAANQAIEMNPDIAKANRPCREIRFYQRQLQTDGVTWKWVRITNVDQAGFEFKVYSFKEGTGPGASYSWNVEMKMPRSIKRNGVVWITLQDEFQFFFDVVRVNDLVSSAIQYIWPRNLSEQPYGDLESNYAFPAVFWGDASLSSSGQCKGVWINVGDIGVLNDPCQTTNFTSGDLSTNMEIGQFNSSGELTSRAINRFIATVHNNTERIVDDGTSATLQPVEAKDIKVRFRIAHWGAALGTGDDWRVISGLQPTDIVDPPFPSKPANCLDTYSFKTTTDADGWLPVQNVPPATGPTVPTPGLGHFFYDWILSGDETGGDVQYYKDVQDHQCVHVEVTSNSDADIITRSIYRNMNFIEASAYSDTARISTKGCGEPPAGRNAHNVFVQTRLKTWFTPKDLTKTGEKWMKSKRNLASMEGYNLALISMRNPNVFITKDIPVDSYAEYLVDTYYGAGNFIIINNKRFDLYSPLGSFGYIAHHGKAVEEWRTKLNGIEKSKNGMYNLAILPNSHLDIKPFIEAKEPYQFVLSLHGGASLPLGTIANTYSTGVNGSVDLEYRKSSNIIFSSLLSYNQFPAKSSSVKDLHITTLSVGVKYYRVINVLFSGYAGLGPEMLMIQDAGSKFGIMGEMGVDLRLNHTFSLELGARYNMEIQRDYEFLNFALGLQIKL